MAKKSDRTIFIYFFILLTSLLCVSIFVIYYWQSTGSQDEYTNQLSDDFGNLKVSVINRNEDLHKCDLKLFLNSEKLVHNNFFFNRSGHNHSVYKFKVEAGKYLINVRSDSLGVNSLRKIDVSDIVWISIFIGDSIEIHFNENEMKFL